METIPFLGEAACLAAALAWAAAVTLFRRAIDLHDAWTINLVRSALGGTLLLLTAAALGELPRLVGAPGRALAIVALSGLAGLALGDTALFAAVARLGVHRALLFQTLGPVFAALLEISVYGVVPSAAQLVGAAVVLVGVTVVVLPDRRLAARRSAGGDAARGDRLGIALAVLAAFGQGSGIVLAKDGMHDLPIISASAVRLLTGGAGVALFMWWTRRLHRIPTALAAGALRQVALPTLLGTYLAFILMMAGIAWTPAAVSSVLLGTSPVFSLFLDRLTVDTRITPRGLVGTLVAVAGVAILAFGKG